MAKLNKTFVELKLKWSHCIQFAFVHHLFRIVWKHIIACSSYKNVKYHRLKECLASPQTTKVINDNIVSEIIESSTDVEVDPVMVSLKISLLGDRHIGKTSFMIKYVGDVEGEGGLHMTGLNLMDKVLFFRGVGIAFSIWDVGGDEHCVHHVPIACKDAVAILIMFDLTSRCTLNNAIGWFQCARKWNKTAIPILIGTKFDNFVQLPLDMQWTIVTQARACTRAMKATLFFSSATHNINVNKIFKFIVAKLFNLPWTIERNLNIGEPIIDY